MKSCLIMLLLSESHSSTPCKILILALFYLCDILSVPITPVSSHMHPNLKTRSLVRLLITLFMDNDSILEEHRVDFSIGGFKSANMRPRIQVVGPAKKYIIPPLASERKKNWKSKVS